MTLTLLQMPPTALETRENLKTNKINKPKKKITSIPSYCVYGFKVFVKLLIAQRRILVSVPSQGSEGVVADRVIKCRNHSNLSNLRTPDTL